MECNNHMGNRVAVVGRADREVDVGHREDHGGRRRRHAAHDRGDRGVHKFVRNRRSLSTVCWPVIGVCSLL